MSLYFVDGFDKWATNDPVTHTDGRGPWVYFASGNNNELIMRSGSGKFGGNALRIQNSQTGVGSGQVSFGFTAPPGGYCRVGFWFRNDPDTDNDSGFGLRGTNPTLPTALEETTNLFYTNSGRNTVIGYNTTELQDNVGVGYHWVEIDIRPDGSTIYLDGIMKGGDPAPITAPTWITIWTGYPGQSSFVTNTVLVDDIVVWTNDGIGLTQFPIGPQRIGTIVPNGPGDSTAFTPTAATNWQSVVGAGLAGGTGVTNPGGINALDLHNATAIAWVPNRVHGVTATARGIDILDGGNQLGAVIKHAGTEANGVPVVFPVNQIRAATATIGEGSPGVPLTIPDITNLQIGYRLID